MGWIIVVKNDYEMIKNNYISQLLFKEEVRIFYEFGLLTEEEYNEIINL